MSDLVGAWALERFVTRFSDGRPDVQPFGEGATGLLLYTSDGFMSATLSRASELAGFEDTTLETTARASVEARAAAFDRSMTYAGRWWIEGDEVVHEVEHALAPGVVGRRNRRRFQLDGERLVLSYAITPASGVTRTFELTWRRAR